MVKKINIHILSVIFVLLIFTDCTSAPKTEKTAKNLPKIGHHDIVYEATEGYEVGDTIFHKVPDWNYLNQDSVWIDATDLKGKIWIADFIFTHCPTVCSPMTTNLNEINKKLTDFSDKIQFLSFSIDPKRDTVARLREFIKEHEITAKNWYFFTGEQEETNRMAFEDFQIFAAEDKRAPGGFAHSSNFVLIDEDRYIRGIYNGVDEEAQKQLLEDVLLLLKQK